MNEESNIRLTDKILRQNLITVSSFIFSFFGLSPEPPDTMLRSAFRGGVLARGQNACDNVFSFLTHPTLFLGCGGVVMGGQVNGNRSRLVLDCPVICRNILSFNRLCFLRRTINVTHQVSVGTGGLVGRWAECVSGCVREWMSERVSEWVWVGSERGGECE